MDEEPILNKKLVMDEETDVASMTLLGSDTKLGDPTNERVTY